jgi:hypothetical protein
MEKRTQVYVNPQRVSITSILMKFPESMEKEEANEGGGCCRKTS